MTDAIQCTIHIRRLGCHVIEYDVTWHHPDRDERHTLHATRYMTYFGPYAESSGPVVLGETRSLWRADDIVMLGAFESHFQAYHNGLCDIRLEQPATA